MRRFGNQKRQPAEHRRTRLPHCLALQSPNRAFAQSPNCPVAPLPDYPTAQLPSSPIAHSHNRQIAQFPRHSIAIASTSIIQSGWARAATATSVEAGIFFPKNSSRTGRRSARCRMSVR